MTARINGHALEVKRVIRQTVVLPQSRPDPSRTRIAGRRRVDATVTRWRVAASSLQRRYQRGNKITEYMLLGRMDSHRGRMVPVQFMKQAARNGWDCLQLATRCNCSCLDVAESLLRFTEFGIASSGSIFLIEDRCPHQCTIAFQGLRPGTDVGDLPSLER